MRAKHRRKATAARGSESARLEAGETALIGDLSVSVQALWEGMQCFFDPTSYQYGGFVAR